MGKVLLGVVLDSDICKNIRRTYFDCTLHLQIDRFKVLDLDTMMIEDAGIDDLYELINYEPCLNEQGFVDSKVICKHNNSEFVCMPTIDKCAYLAFSGDSLVSEDSCLIRYRFSNFDLIFNARNCTYSIVVFNKYDLTEYSYRVDYTDGNCTLENIELESVSSLCEKIDDDIYLVNDCLIVNKLKKCIILPNKAKKVLFGDYGWSEDLEYNIVIPPSVEQIDFNDLWWTDRINFKYTDYLQISLPSSNFDKLHKSVVDNIINKIKRKLAMDFSLDTSRIITLYDNGDLPDEELAKLLDDLSIKIFKY